MKKLIEKILCKFIWKLKLGYKRSDVLDLILKFDDSQSTNTRLILKQDYGIEIGKYSYGCFKIDGSIIRGTKIGAFCSIGSGGKIGGVQHPQNYISTHPFLYNSNRGFIPKDLILDIPNRAPIIEDDVWIGENVVMLNNVIVGKGAIVGAGAVVTKNVPPYSVVAGVPAKILKYRFSEEEIDSLLMIDWGQWDDEYIQENINNFYSVKAFLNIKK